MVERAPLLGPYASICVSIDSALSTSQTSDYSAITVVTMVDTAFYVLSAERGRWDYEQLKREVTRYLEHYGTRDRQLTFVVEHAGSGVSLHQYLDALRVRTGRFRVFKTTPRLDKMTRAAYALPAFDSGRIHVVDTPGNTWVEPFVNEFLSFPNGRHDDQVDSLVQLVNYERKVFLRSSFYCDSVG